MTDGNADHHGNQHLDVEDRVPRAAFGCDSPGRHPLLRPLAYNALCSGGCFSTSTRCTFSHAFRQRNLADCLVTPAMCGVSRTLFAASPCNCSSGWSVGGGSSE